MGELNFLAKFFLNADTKKLIKAGLMNSDLSLTSEGEKALLAILCREKKQELVKMAKEILEEKKNEEVKANCADGSAYTTYIGDDGIFLNKSEL